jgi:6-phosphogluconolactonase
MMKVCVLPDLEAISRKAAEMFLNFSRQYVSSLNRFVVAISGGTTPGRLYALLASDIFRKAIDWSHIHFFWADERCVPKENDESNYGLTFYTLLSRVPVPPLNIHRIKGEKDPKQGAREYETDIRSFFGTSGLPVFDLIMLGMGEDGHTASLFPGSKSLKETERLAVPVYREKPESHRISLTLPVLNNARQVIFLVAGRSKANMVRLILKGGQERKRYPAGLIDPSHGNILWLIDQEAAGKLTDKELMQPG